MTTPGRLSVDSEGKVRGNVAINYNDPWPCVNGRLGVTGTMSGVLEHTMVANLPSCIASFNNPSRQASAHFGIAQDGTVHQFGPLGRGWEAWHAMAANATWYGIEHADDGNPNNPLTDAQIAASAQVVECLSAFAGFPLQVTDSVTGHGYGTHSMGGAAWGGHTCPDLPPKHVRSAQRPAIIDLAKLIRASTRTPLPSGRCHADGHTSLAGLAQRQGCGVPDIWWSTAAGMAAAGNTGFGDLQRPYMAAGQWDALMPSGMILWLP